MMKICNENKENLPGKAVYNNMSIEQLTCIVKLSKATLVKKVLKSYEYLDMDDTQMSVVVEYETKKWKKKVTNLIWSEKYTRDQIQDIIHDWWLDYRIADDTETNLLAYAASAYMGSITHHLDSDES